MHRALVLLVGDDVAAMTTEPTTAMHVLPTTTPAAPVPRLGIIFLGPMNSGKTTMMYVYGAKTRVREGTTIQEEQLVREREVVNDVVHTITFKDVPGQDLYAENLIPATLRGIHVAIIVADVTRAHGSADPVGSLGIAKWLDAVRRIDPTIGVLIALNKADVVQGVKTDRGSIVGFPGSVVGLLPVSMDAVNTYLSSVVPPSSHGEKRVFLVSAKTRDGMTDLLYASMNMAYARSLQQPVAAVARPAPVNSQNFGQKVPPKPAKSCCP
jgi:hypothetical protein